MEILTLSSELSIDRFASGKARRFGIQPTAAEIAELVVRFDFVSIEDMRAEVTVRKVARDCWDVAGTLSARVAQRCVITGNDVPELVDFTIEERYVREAENDDGVEVDLNGAEPLVGGAIDIGEMVAQTLGVAVAPWPKSPASADSLIQEEISDEHPFAGLAALRKPE
jgi:uncharacterized metal-binding protein YceD (DUF177 family)